MGKMLRLLCHSYSARLNTEPIIQHTSLQLPLLF
uniref:Uncharacterized protein n=1 Tax=Anguilla anguilla TaxID=7936 RepID=A0A0E9W0D4_ANGAN